jgi:hypothetical protein
LDLTKTPWTQFPRAFLEAVPPLPGALLEVFMTPLLWWWLLLAQAKTQDLVVTSPPIDAILDDARYAGDETRIMVVPFEPAAGTRQVKRVTVTKAMRQACGFELPAKDEGPSIEGAVHAGNLVVAGFKDPASSCPGVLYCVLDKAGRVLERGESRGGVYVLGNRIMVFEWHAPDKVAIMRCDRDPSPGEPVVLTDKWGRTRDKSRLMTALERTGEPRQFVRVSETSVVPVLEAAGGQEVVLDPAGEDAWRLWRWAPTLKEACYIRRVRRKGSELLLRPDSDPNLTKGCADFRPGSKAAQKVLRVNSQPAATSGP